MAVKVTHNIERMNNRGTHSFVSAILSCEHAVPGPLFVGTMLECEQCDRQRAARQKIRAAVAAGQLSHTRASRVSHQKYDAYVYDRTMPTGVRHLASLEASDENRAFLRTIGSGMTPLSPTEAR